MIVEDSVSQNYLYSHFIQKLGYYTISAINGKDAITKLERSKLENSLPDLILLDLRMPIMNGFEFIHKVKKDHKYKDFKDIPILLCTSLEDKPKLRSIRKYITDCIFKNSVKDLRVKITNALNNINI